MQRGNLKAAAANYSYLRLVRRPGGRGIHPRRTGELGSGPATSDVGVSFVAVVVAGAACLPIARYYRENYGRFRPSARQQVRGAVAVVIGVAVFGGASLLLRSRAGWSLDLPVNATAVSFALFMLISYGIGVGLKAHHVIIWGALLVVGAVPVWHGADPGNIGLVLAGVAVMVSGVFDHRLFVHTFGPARVLRSRGTAMPEP